MSKILITGGAGFIGRHVVRAFLRLGHAVRVFDNLSAQIHGPVPSSDDLAFLLDEKVEFLRGSVGNLDELRTALDGIETVIHLAAETGTAQSMYAVSRYCDVNVGGTANLLDLLANDASRTVKRIVLASSRSVYGEGAYVCNSCSPGTRRFPASRDPSSMANALWEHLCADCNADLTPVATEETDAAQPASIYAASKLAQEQLLSISCQALGVEHVVLRLQNVYGEGQSLANPYTGILSVFSTRARLKQVLPIFEDGNETRDFVYVGDVARVIVLAATLQNLPFNVVNVGSGLRTTIAEVAEALSDALDVPRNLRVTGQYRLGDIRHNFASTSRLALLLDGHPVIGLREGIRRFAEWVSEQAIPEDRLERANDELRQRKLLGE